MEKLMKLIINLTTVNKINKSKSGSRENSLRKKMYERQPTKSKRTSSN